MTFKVHSGSPGFRQNPLLHHWNIIYFFFVALSALPESVASNFGATSFSVSRNLRNYSLGTLSSIWSKELHSNRLLGDSSFCPDVHDKTKCSNQFLSLIKKQCNVKDASFEDYRVHYESGALKWINTVSYFGRNPSHVEKLVFTSNVDKKQWLISYLKDFTFWFCLMAFGILWSIIGCICCPALCSSKFRGCVSSCFCKKCCKDRQRKDPESSYSTRTKWIIFGIVVALFVFFFIFTLTSIIYSFFIFQDIEFAACAALKASYIGLYGDNVYRKPALFKGFVGIPETVAEITSVITSSLSFSEVSIKTITTFSSLYQSQTITPFIKSLDDTRNEMRLSNTMEMGSFAGASKFDLISGYYCVGCEMTNPAGPLGQYQLTTITTIINTYTKALGGVMSGFNNHLRSSINSFNDWIRRIDLKTMANKVVNSVVQISKYSDMVEKSPLAKLTLAIFVIFPSMAFLFFVATCLLLGSLTKDKFSKFRPSDKGMKRLSGWFCCSFSGLGIMFLMLGSIVFVIHQPPCEFCSLVYNDFFHKNRYSEMRIFGKFANFSTTSFECLTDRGEGDFLRGVSSDFNLLATFNDAISSMKQGVTDSFAELNKSVEKLKDADLIFKALVPIIALKATFKTQGKFYYSGYAEIVFGSVTDEDVNGAVWGKKDARYIALTAILLDIEKDRAASLSSVSFEGRSAPPNQVINSRNFITGVAPSTNPPLIFGLNAQIAKLNSVLAPTCPLKFCITTGTPVGCIAINPRIAIDPLLTAASTAFQLKPIMLAPQNQGQIAQLWTFNCIGGKTDEEIIRWINSYNVVVQRIRIRQSIQTYPFFTVKGLTMYRVNYDDFLKHVIPTWSSIYSMDEIEAETAKLQTQMQDLSVNPLRDLKNIVNCKVAYDQLKGLTDFGCRNFVYDIGVFGLSWSMLSAGCLFATFLTWKLFHYYSDVIRFPTSFTSSDASESFEKDGPVQATSNEAKNQIWD